MPWIYSQSTGKLFHDATFIGTGYSGAGHTPESGRNNPEMESVHNTGPLPRGQYSIGAAYKHPHKGPISMNLTPTGHEALGRAGFMIHGNNAQDNASEGCIIMGPAIRQQIATSGDPVLIVKR